MPHSILDLISERQTVVAITDLREQIGKLTNDRHTAEIELSDLATTRTTLNRLTATSDGHSPSGSLEITVYQQILAVFTTGLQETRLADDAYEPGRFVVKPADDARPADRGRRAAHLSDRASVPNRPDQSQTVNRRPPPHRWLRPLRGLPAPASARAPRRDRSGPR